jgi:hypothetical protein
MPGRIASLEKVELKLQKLYRFGKPGERLPGREKKILVSVCKKYFSAKITGAQLSCTIFFNIPGEFFSYNFFCRH